VNHAELCAVHVCCPRTNIFVSSGVPECACRQYWDVTLDDAWIWELDSSDTSKWSRHIIITIPGRAFANNLVLGSFVQQILSLPQVHSHSLPWHTHQEEPIGSDSKGSCADSLTSVVWDTCMPQTSPWLYAGTSAHGGEARCSQSR
jgi:hypothetical protein